MTPDSVISSHRSLPSRVRSPDARKHGETAVILGDVVDQFHDDDGFAHACAAEQADFAALQERLNQIDDLDAGLKHFGGGGLLVESRSER